jgi:hypothetical protein
MLPLEYRIVFLKDLSVAIYEEEDYELNEILVIKKVIFLLINLSDIDGDSYEDIRKVLKQW